MTYRAAGKYVRINKNHPRALGVCDQTGFIHNKSDLVKQMEWRGDSLAWTGFLVGKDFVDKPNEQGRAPRIPIDPKPVVLPRPKQAQENTFFNNNWPPLNELQFPLTGLDGGEQGNLMPSGQQRLANLQNFNWSGS